MGFGRQGPPKSTSFSGLGQLVIRYPLSWALDQKKAVITLITITHCRREIRKDLG